VDPELKRRIQDLIDYKGGGFNEDNVADIIESALKLLTDVEDTGDVRVIQTAIRELRYAFKLFAPYSQSRKVHDLRFGAHAAIAHRIPTGRRVRTQNRGGRFHGDHGGRRRHHASGA